MRLSGLLLWGFCFQCDRAEPLLCHVVGGQCGSGVKSVGFETALLFPSQLRHFVSH